VTDISKPEVGGCVKYSLAMIKLATPTSASQLILPSVLMLAKDPPTMAARATKTAVHVPCIETAFRPMEMPSIMDPATKV
jgi:hypothetical protein